MKLGLRIPESGKKAFRQLFAMSEYDFKSVIEGIKALPEEFFARENFGSILMKRLPSLDREFLEEIATAIMTMYDFRQDENFPRNEYRDEIVRIVKEQFQEDSDKPDEKIVEERLTEFLSIVELEKWVRADYQQRNYEHIYNGVEIQSDIRPVYGSNDKKGEIIDSVFLVHNLKIEYTENGEEKFFFVALDSEDVDALMQKLKSTIDRISELEQKIRLLGWTYYSTSSERRKK